MIKLTKYLKTYDVSLLCLIKNLDDEMRWIKKLAKLIFGAIIQVGFAELKRTADDRVNIGGTIIGAPIIGQ